MTPRFRVSWTKQSGRAGTHGWRSIEKPFDSAEEALGALGEPFGSMVTEGVAQRLEGNRWIRIGYRKRGKKLQTTT